MAFPQVAAVSGGNNASDSKQHTVNLPDGIQSGDLLLVFFAADGYPTITFPGGWTQLFQTANSSYVAFGAWYRIADGEEGATITVETSTWEMSAHTSYRITGYSGTPEAGISATSNSSWPDPPSLTPTWGAEDTLWFACEGNDHQYSVSSYPTNYADGRNDIASPSTGCGVGTCRRELNAVSENPGTFTIAASEQWVANIIAIQPILVTVPTVTTQAVTSIGKTAATGHGTIAATGGENCDKRGVCWNTGGNPTVADDKSEEAGSFGTGAFTRPMTGLDPGTHYYVRAYAHNSAGYGYGSQVEFTTTQVVSPSSIASHEAFGDPTVLPGKVIISPTSIASLESFGTPAILPGVVIISPTSIASLEAFGIPIVILGLRIYPSSIPSAE